MTLDTRVLILKPYAVAEVRDWINAELFGAPDARPIDAAYWREAYPERLTDGNAGGQGLPAWLMIHYNADGPSVVQQYVGDDAEGNETYAVVGEGSMVLSFDTAYGYRDEQGRSCSELHREYVARLVERFGPVVYLNEFTGEWHSMDDPTEPVHIS